MVGLVALSALAQHTEVKKNGVNGKIETDYNAAGKAVEMRTIGPDGKVQQKVEYEYLPGYYGPQQRDTTYWPNGKIRKVVGKNYDESANYTGEFIQTFDESGKQIGGHKLTHDPWAGTYRCAEWNAAVKDYRSVACPSGEEEGGGGGAHEARRFSVEEVMRHLEAARKNASAEKEFGRLHGYPTGAATSNEIGLVLPAEVYPGERISGTLVEAPDHYVESTGVRVVRIRLPIEPGEKVSGMSGWMFDAPGEEAQRADGPITMVAPRGGSEMKIVLRKTANPDQVVEQTVKFSQPAQPVHPADSFRVAALCMKDGLCEVSGPFLGDGKTFAAFEDSPGVVIAESSRAAYIRVPESVGPGAHALFVAEGSKVIALPAVVGNFFVRNNGQEMQPGESLITFPTLEGPEDIPDSAWEIGDLPEASLERARQLIPGFSATGGRCAEQEETEARKEREADANREGEADADRDKDKDKGKAETEARKDRGAEHAREGKEEAKAEGKIVLVVKNRSAEQNSLHGAGGETIYFCLGDEAFGRGPFKYDLRVDARKSGRVDVSGYVIPLLAPVSGQEFSAAGK